MRYIAIFLLALLPLQVFAVNGATSQLLVGRNVGSGGTAATTNLILSRVANPGTQTASSTVGALATGGQFSHLVAYVDAAPGGSASWTVTLEDNTFLTNLTCVITSANTSCGDDVDSYLANASTNLSVQFTANNAPVATFLYFSIKFSPTTNNQTVMLFASGGNNLSGTLENYTPVASALAPQVTEQTQTNLLPEGGTFSNLVVGLNSAPSPGNYTFTVRNFSAAATSTLTCNNAAASLGCSDTTHTYATSSPAAGVAGDLVDLADQPAASAATRLSGGGVVFSPNNVGDFFFNGGMNTDSATLERYEPIVGQSNPVALIGSTTVKVDAMVVKDFQVVDYTAPGGTASKTYTIMVNSATSSFPTCTITGTATGCHVTGSLTLVRGNTMTIAIVPSGTPATSKGQSAITAFFPAPEPAILSILGAILKIIGASFKIRI